MKFRTSLKTALLKIAGWFRHIARDRIKPVFLLFFHDLKTIRNSKATLAIVIGLCILPSLYAWVNIYACWDPYANTGNLPVAIVNNDEGTVMNGEIINVGETVIDELKENKSIGWEFVDDWQGNYGLNEGKYYAMIEIPRNFSERLTSLATTTPQKPVITYRVNEKLNAIASKITSVAKDRLIESIESSFVRTVNEKVMDTLKSESDNMKMDSSRLKELKKSLEQADKDITNAKEQIEKANKDSESLKKHLEDASALSPKITAQINSLQELTAAGASLAQKTQTAVETIAENISDDLNRMQELNRQNQQLIAHLKAINDNTLDENTKEILRQNITMCNSLSILLTTDIADLDDLNDSYDLNSLTLLINSLRYANRLVLAQQDAMQQLVTIKNNSTSKETIAKSLDTISKLSDEIAQTTQTLSSTYTSQGAPLLNSLGDSIVRSLNSASGLIGSTSAIVPQLDALSAFTQASSGIAVQQGNRMIDLLDSVQEDLNKILEKIDDVSSEDIETLEDIIHNNPTVIADFIASPLEVVQTEVYKGGTFGEGLTPFYTVLAIWVGVLLLCAFLTVHCNEMEGYQLNLKQKHFGKMTLFLFLSLIQSTIITIGDVILLGVKPQDFGLMLLFSALCSVTFVVIIFTLVSLFGNVGKAIAVIIMVFQIAGAGGIYPIQTNPRIFGILHPLWPFTYGINGFREAIAGPTWEHVRANIIALIGFILVFLPLSALQNLVHKLTAYFERRFKQAGL